MVIHSRNNIYPIHGDYIFPDMTIPLILWLTSHVFKDSRYITKWNSKESHDTIRFFLMSHDSLNYYSGFIWVIRPPAEPLKILLSHLMKY